jgi:hypothetical protein
MLTVDPGETTGWALWDEDGDPVEAGQTPLWQFLDAVDDHYRRPATYTLMKTGVLPKRSFELRTALRDVAPALIVAEDFRIYEWKCKELAFDGVRTARGLGALQQTARAAGIDFVLQPAKIKHTAQAAGAEELYYEPVHENRHANDALQHGVFYKVAQAHPVLQNEFQSRPNLKDDGLA